MGFQSRTRACTPPQHGGVACAHTAETRPCNVRACPTDCVVHAWGAFVTCDRSCGHGTQTRTRTFVQPTAGGKACPTDSDSRSCNTHACPVDCVVEPNFSQWSTCTKSCGGGFQSRSRTLVVPKHGGKKCPHSAETRACNHGACAVHCEVSGFSSWSTCTKTCGGGTRSRRLTVPRLASETSGLVARADSLDEAKAALSAIRIESSTSMGYAAGLKHTAPGATLGAIAEPPALRRMASGFGGAAPAHFAAEMPMYRGLSAAIDDDDEAPSCRYRSLAAADDAPSGVVYRSAAAAAAPAAAAEPEEVKLEEAELSREQFARLYSKQKHTGAL